MKDIIIGRSGSGKTEYIIKKIQEDLQAGYDNIIVIVPDQFTFETERELIFRTGKGLFEIRVLSFRRLISTLRNELGTGGCFELDEVNKAMFVNKLLYDYNNELKVYKGAYRTPGFSFDMAKTITECKQFGASFEDLQAMDIGGKTKDKISDIATVYKAYTNFKDKFKDNEDIINIITKRIPQSKILNGARVYIDHFDVFTFQGYNTIEQIANVCSSLAVCICSDKSKNGLFSMTTDTIEKLRARVPDINTIKLDSSYCYGAIGHLERNLFDGKQEIMKDEDDSVEMFSFSNAMAEVDHAIAKIIELKNSGYKYKDICLMAGGIDEYGTLIEQCMRDCGVPYFIDKKTALMSCRIAKFVIYSLKNCFLFDQSPFIGMIKQGIMLQSREDICAFENYVLKLGLARALSPIKDDEYIENLRKQVSIAKLKSPLLKAKTVREMATCVINYLYSFEIAFDSELEERSFNKIIEILERMQLIFEDSDMELELFTSILETGMLSVTLGEIPDKKDCVVIGDISRTKIQKAKCLLVLGISDGVIPKLTQKSGLLSDYDSAQVNKHFKIGRDSFDLNSLEQLLTYKMFSKPTDYLYLSHSDRGIYGNERENKLLFPKIQRLLGGKAIQRDVPFNEDMALRLLNSKRLAYKSLAASAFCGADNYITRAVYYEYNKENGELFKPKVLELTITDEQVKDIYKDTVISATRIESYFKCAFMQFVKYGLRPKRRELYKINKLDTGSLLHSIIDEFSVRLIESTKKYRENGKDLDELYHSVKEQITDKGMVDDIVKARLKEDGLSVYSEDNIGRIMARRITDMGKGALIGIIDDLRASDFVMTYSEQDLKALGERDIVGRIDRVDVSGNGIRIVDYKTGGSKLDYSGIYAGIKLQLIIYMSRIMKYYREKQNKQMLPLALEYYRVSPEYQNLDDVDKFLKAESKQGGAALTVGAEGKSGGIIQEDMEKIIGFGMERANQAVKNIYKGDIAIRPYAFAGSGKDNGCEYCDFKNICKNENLENKRVLKKAELEDIIGESDNLE